MYELKKIGTVFLRVNLLGPGPRLMKKEFTGPRSHKGWETLPYTNLEEAFLCLHSEHDFVDDILLYYEEV